MRAKVIRKSLIIDDVEQEVGDVIEVSEGLCARSLKLEPVNKPKAPAPKKATGTKAK